MGSFQSQEVALAAHETPSHCTLPIFRPGLAMYGRIFLGSNFEGLRKFRSSIRSIIQKESSLQCLSFQWDHAKVYPARILADIRKGLKASSHYFFFLGPRYGELISDHPDLFIPKGFLTSRKISFTHAELRYALKKLSERAPKNDPYRSDFYNSRVLVFKLKPFASPEDAQALMDLESELRSFGLEARPLPSKPIDELADGIVDDAKLVNTIRDFLHRIKTDTVAPVNDFLHAHPITEKDHVQIAGWSGLENYSLHESFMFNEHMRDDHLSFLTMNRSIVSLPSSTRYFPRRNNVSLGFDFLFTDIEIIPNYVQSSSIRHFSDDVLPGDPGFFVDLISRLKRTAMSDQFVYAVPLMYGFNEILECQRPNDPSRRAPKRIKNIPNRTASYAEYDLPHLLSHKRCSVGIWGWWLASFPILLFSHLTRLKQLNFDGQYAETLRKLLCDCSPSPFTSADAFSDWFERESKDSQRRTLVADMLSVTTQSILAELKAKYDPRMPRVRIFSTLRAKRDNLSNGKHAVDVVIGSSSAIIPSLYGENTIFPVVPLEGVFLWINCLCAYSKDIPGRQADLVRHWLSEEGQRSLSRIDPLNMRRDGPASEYVGMPVTKAALKILTTDEQSAKRYEPILSTMRLVQPEEFRNGLYRRRKATITASLRPFSPFTWPLIEYHWNQLIDGLRDLDLVAGS